MVQEQQIKELIEKWDKIEINLSKMASAIAIEGGNNSALVGERGRLKLCIADLKQLIKE